MFDYFVISYLFLGGLSAGATIMLSVLCTRVPTSVRASSVRSDSSGYYSRLFGFGFGGAAVTGLFGAFLLIVDMHRPQALLTMLYSPALTIVSIGAYSLGLMIVFVTVLSLLWGGVVHVVSPLEWPIRLIAVCCALVVISYTALLLKAIGRVPLFQSPFILVLFTLSSFSTGTGLVLLSASLSGVFDVFNSAMKWLMDIDIVVLTLEIITLAGFIVHTFEIAPASVAMLVSGDYRVQFWFGLVSVGLVFPLILEVTSRFMLDIRYNPSLIAITLMIGGFLLRWCIVMAA